MTPLSPHFTLEEFTFSEAAQRRGIPNEPDVEQLVNLKLLAERMEEVRAWLGRNQLIVPPIRVHSAFRSFQVNTLVGGVSTSAHLKGLACDFTCPEFGTPYEVAREIQESGIAFDQLILEYGWVHLGLPADGLLPRTEVLTKRSALSHYEHGINA